MKTGIMQNYSQNRKAAGIFDYSYYKMDVVRYFKIFLPSLWSSNHGIRDFKKINIRCLYLILYLFLTPPHTHTTGFNIYWIRVESPSGVEYTANLTFLSFGKMYVENRQPSYMSVIDENVYFSPEPLVQIVFLHWLSFSF